MNEKLLYESQIVEAETIAPGSGQTDIAQQTPKTFLARSVLSQSLPYMIGFVQKLYTPTGFVFGFKSRDTTAITHSDFPASNQGTPSKNITGADEHFTTRNPADPMTVTNEVDGLGGTVPAEQATDSPAQPDDPLIIRRLVQTETREIVFDLTNETIQDINSLFGTDFPELLGRFIEKGGELYGFDNDEDVLTVALESFFLPQMMSRATQKINTDFTNWADAISTNIGTVQIPDLGSMHNIFTAIGEMREKLSDQTNKSGSVFIICTPRIANYIAGTLGMTASNGGFFLEKGKPNQNPHLNGFIGQFGDIKVYQYRGQRTNNIESIIMGFDGVNGPNTASVYYHPYKEYIIQGGDNYTTGHSNIFYRVRDTWTVNPQDTFDKTQTSPIQDPANDLPNDDNTSQYLVRAEFDITERAIN